MSALCQKQTLARSFDHLVGDGKHARWNGKPERLCCFEINHQREPTWLQDQQVRGFRAIEYFSRVKPDLSVGVINVDTVTDETARYRIFAKMLNSWNCCACGQGYEPIAMDIEEW
jgi:hypothetical protein